MSLFLAFMAGASIFGIAGLVVGCSIGHKMTMRSVKREVEAAYDDAERFIDAIKAGDIPLSRGRNSASEP